MVTEDTITKRKEKKTASSKGSLQLLKNITHPRPLLLFEIKDPNIAYSKVHIPLWNWRKMVREAWIYPTFATE